MQTVITYLAVQGKNCIFLKCRTPLKKKKYISGQTFKGQKRIPLFNKAVLTLIHMACFLPVFQLIPHGIKSYMPFEAPPPSPLPHNGGIVETLINPRMHVY